MQSFGSRLHSQIAPNCLGILPSIQCRCASLTSAIKRGIRRGQNPHWPRQRRYVNELESVGDRNTESLRKSYNEQETSARRQYGYEYPSDLNNSATFGSRDYKRRDDKDAGGHSFGSKKSHPTEFRPSVGRRRHRAVWLAKGTYIHSTDNTTARRDTRRGANECIRPQENADNFEFTPVGRLSLSSKRVRRTGLQDHPRSMPANFVTNAPISVPYTTAASEFLYGTFAVKAALQAKRRNLYTLYSWRGEDGAIGEEDPSIREAALGAGVKVVDTAGNWAGLLSKMAGGRPHNGYVLETSPIPKLPIQALEKVAPHSETFDVAVVHQSDEDLQVNKSFITGQSSHTPGAVAIPALDSDKRFPFLLFLDRILDPGNLGAIIRSAYFLGVDAVILVDHMTAPLGPVAVKASAGAAELVPILVVKNEIAFIRKSKENGWQFIAAVAEQKSGPREIPRTALKQDPCVLMLGSEGEGLRPELRKLADNVASIKSARPGDKLVDSLNVSVAAGVLSRELLHCARSTELPDIDRDLVKSRAKSAKVTVAKSGNDILSRPMPQAQSGLDHEVKQRSVATKNANDEARDSDDASRIF